MSVRRSTECPRGWQRCPSEHLSVRTARAEQGKVPQRGFSPGGYSLGKNQDRELPDGGGSVKGRMSPLSNDENRNCGLPVSLSISNPVGHIQVLVLTIRHQGNQDG